MPTENNISEVERLKGLFESASIVISTDFTGLRVGDMSELRGALRQRGVEFRVVKNTLALLAAEAAGKPLIKEIVQGPTGIAFGFDDPLEPAKGLTEFVKATRLPLRIVGGVLGDRSLSPGDIGELARLPGREEIIAHLLGQLLSPITSLVYVLNGPVASLARVLQRRIEAMGDEGGSSPQVAPAEPGSAAGAEQPGENPSQ